MSVEYDTADLKDMIKKAFNFNELDEFTFEHFPEVKEELFSPALSLPLRIIDLIEYCERRERLPMLVRKVREARPEIYEKYAGSLIISRSTAWVEFVSDAAVKVDELTDKQKEALATAFKIGLAGVLGVDPGELAITSIASGSINLIVRMAEELIPTLYEKRQQIVEETGFSLSAVKLATPAEAKAAAALDAAEALSTYNAAKAKFDALLAKAEEQGLLEAEKKKLAMAILVHDLAAEEALAKYVVLLAKAGSGEEADTLLEIALKVEAEAKAKEEAGAVEVEAMSKSLSSIESIKSANFPASKVKSETKSGVKVKSKAKSAAKAKSAGKEMGAES